ncbi:hypothetical protein VU05_05010, partial [Desulfobulbus sp. F1]|nr:hypothetical protein [Desulfobulbus sp. F1]
KQEAVSCDHKAGRSCAAGELNNILNCHHFTEKEDCQQHFLSIGIVDCSFESDLRGESAFRLNGIFQG